MRAKPNRRAWPPRARTALALAALALTTGCGASLPGEGPASDGAALERALPDVSPTTGPESAPQTSPRPPRPRKSAPATVDPDLVVPDLRVPPRLRGPVLGGDVSWPQCPRGMGIPEKQGLGLPMPLPEARYVILGLTNGPGFTPNPCLADQVRWVRERRLMAAAYAVSSYPDRPTLDRYGDDGPFDGGTALGALRNVGYQQALFNVATMRAAGLRSPVVWVDVEPVPVFEWSDDPVANAAVVIGAVQGYLDSGYQVGTYSTAYLWETVVGDLRLDLPEWRAAGQTSRAEALRRCGPEYAFQGGSAVLAQWVENDRDLNVTCPGTSQELYRWFHQY